MALSNSGFTTMSGYVQRMKEEADRREEEEKRKQEEEARRQSLASWRRDVPVGPPTQEQARGPQIGPIEKPKSNITLPQQKPTSFEVSRPETDTSTPSLSSSQVTGNTVQSRVNPSAFNPGSMTMDALAKWNPPAQPPKLSLPQMPPKNTGVAMPLGPSLLPQVGQQLLGMGQNLVQGLSNGQWQMPDYQEAIKTLQEQAPDMLKAIFPQGTAPATGVPGPADMAYQHMQNSIAQRNKERANVSVGAELTGTLLGGLTGNAQVGSMFGKAAKALTPIIVSGMNALDVINMLGDAAQSQPVVQGGANVSEIFNTARAANDMWTNSVDGLNNPLINTTDPNAWNYMSPEAAKNLVLFDPNLYANIPNMTEYWDMATKGMRDAFIPSSDQKLYNTPEQIEWAKNYSRFMTQSGLAARTQTFDDILDAPVNAAKKMQRANQLAQMADMTTDETLRTQIYAEAGRISAEAVKLRDQTPLDVYNKNYDIRYAGPLGIFVDPTNVVGVVSELAGLTLAARRAAQGQKLIDLGNTGAVAGSNKTLLESGKDFLMEWMKTGRSKSYTDAAINSSVISNALSGVSTVGDIKLVLSKLVDGSIMGGIPLDQFNGVEMAVQAVDGLVDFGTSGIKDWRFQKSKAALAPIAGWINNIPSLQGEATDIANKVLLQGDVLGLLVRSAAQTHDVSKMGDIPWGAARFRVSPTTANKAVVEYLDEAKNVIGTSTEMTLREATKLQANYQGAIAAGSEFKDNWLRNVANFRRNLMSTFSINISPGQLINNAGGGMLTDMMNRGFDQEYFRPLEQKLEYLMNKTGGMIMSSRVAEGAGEIAPSSARFGSQGTLPQGQYDNWWGKMLNGMTFGFAKKGRDLRQGNATIFGGRVAIGEEAMAASIYEAAFKSFFEQEWSARLEPVITQMMQGRIDDPKVVKWITDQLVQTGLAGNRIDLAKTFQEIASGRIALSIRSISPVLGDVIPPADVLELDKLLRNLGVESIDAVNTRITEIFAAQRKLLDMDSSKFVEQFGKRAFTRADDAKDQADIQQMFQTIARLTGQNLDIGANKAKEVGELQKKLSEYLLELMRMSEGQPGNIEYLMDVWNRVQDMKDTVRRNVGTASANLRQFAKEAKMAVSDTLESVGAPGPNRAPDAGPVRGTAYTVDESGNVLPGAATPKVDPGGLTEAAPGSDFAGSRFTSAGPRTDKGVPWSQGDNSQVADYARTQMGQSSDPAVDNLLNFNVQEEWNKFFAYADGEWKKFGDDAIAVMEEARTAIDNGTAKNFIQQRILASMPDLPDGSDMTVMMNEAQEMMSNTGIDLEMLDAVLKQKFGFKDPRFEGALTTLRQGVDHWQRQMFVALSRYPTQEAFDEYMGAIREVSVERGRLMGKLRAYTKKINDTENPLGKAEAAALFKQFEQASKEGWNKWWNFAVNRYKVGAYRVIETNLGPDAFKGLTFTPYADGKVWTVLGPSVQKPKVWNAINEAGEMAEFPIGKGGVSKEVVDKFYEIRKATELEIMDQLGRLGYQQGKTQGAEAADEWLSKWEGPGTRDLLNQIRATVAERLANYDAKPFIPADLPGWYRTKLDQGEVALKQVLAQVAQANSGGYGRMGMDSISDFNRNVLPLFDDVISGAHRYGEEMLSAGLVNFTNEYHPDVLLGLGAPYHYWWSRSLKNSLERELFDPKVTRFLSKAVHDIETRNREDNQPNRNLTSIPGSGPKVGDATYRAGLQGILRMIPWFPNMMMNGWSNPDVANRAYEYSRENAMEQAFPATAKGWANNAAVLYELANEFGLNTYPEYDAILDWAQTGQSPELRGKIGDTSSLLRTLGWGAVALAEWARDNNVPLVPPIAEGFAAGTVPDYAPSLYSRQAAFDVNAGKMTDNQGQMVQDVFAQQYQGLNPMPEQGVINPNAVQQAGDVRQKVAMEYFVRGLLSWVSGVPVAAVYDSEGELREGQSLKARSGYDPTDNTAGSQTARFSYTDPNSENFVPGLATYEDRYAVMGETDPQRKGNVQRPGMGPAQSEYYDKADAIKQKYLAEQQAEYDKHPEWKTIDGLDGKNAYDKDWKDRKEAEEKALADKYPSVIAAQGKEKGPWSLYGARPSETEREAQVRLRNQAYKELEASRPKEFTREEKAALSNSEKVANSKAWDAWNAKLDARIAELMNDPQAASASVFDRALPRVGEQPAGSVSDVLRGKDTATPTMKNVVPQAQPKAADPNNQWATQMGAAEQEFGLPSGMLEALARRESNFTPAPSNGFGMMQMEDAAWEQAADALGLTDREDPEQAVRAAAYYMNWVNDNLSPDKQGDPAWMAAGYNMGVTAVNKMTSLEDIKKYDRYGEQRYSYVNDIAQASSGGDSDNALSSRSPFSGDYELTQTFGVNPERYKSWGGHMGLDYAMPVGTELLATEDGTVVDVGNSPKGGNPSRPGTGGFGNWIIVQYPSGYTAEYAHLSEIQVKPGDKVTGGQVIGLSGHTGVSDFPHLHFGIREGGPDGKYVDPTAYLSQGGVSKPTTSSATPTLEGADPNAIAWSQTPQQVADAGRNSNKSEARQESDASIEAAFQGQIDRAIKTYPKYGKLFEDYKAVNDEDREAWRLKNPMIRALNFVAYNPDEWTKLEKDYGKGIIEKWALIPPYAGEDSDVRSVYYHANPDVFLVNAWIKGRPEKYDDSGFVPDAEFSYNLGADFDEAKRRFGDGIWDTVRLYYSTPKYVKGGDNTAWLAFKEEHPEFDAWSAWWYEKMGNQKDPYQFNQWGSSGFSGFSGRSAGFQEPQYIKGVEAMRQAPPKWSEGGSGGDDWRKYLALGELQLKGWRR